MMFLTRSRFAVALVVIFALSALLAYQLGRFGTASGRTLPNQTPGEAADGASSIVQASDAASPAPRLTPMPAAPTQPPPSPTPKAPSPPPITPTPAPSAPAPSPTPSPTPIASAKLPETRTISLDVILPANGSKSSLLSCPAGFSPTGAGFELVAGADIRAILAEPRSGSAPGWSIGAENHTANPVVLTGHGVCAKLDTSISVNIIKVIPWTFSGFEVKCDKFFSPVGGGMILAPRSIAKEVRPVRSAGQEPITLGWKVGALNGDLNYWSLAYIVCSSQASSVVMQAEKPIGSGSGSVSVRCPAGTVVTAGGFNYDGVTTGTDHVWLSRPEGNGWMVSAFNGGTATRLLQVSAVCTRL
jgi:hypothetical protein